MCAESSAAPFSAFMRPRSVAIVGASARPGTWGYLLVTRLMGSGFRGAIYPVNQRGEPIAGLRTYASIRDIPDAVELAVLMIRPDAMAAALDDCGRSGVRAAIGLTTGFAETGGEGVRTEDELGAVLDRHHMQFIGPNCIGVCCPSSGLNIYFERMPRPGNVAILSQGGGLGVYMCDAARRLDVGLSSFMTLGNQLRTNLIHCLDWLDSDEDTKAIALYVEGAPRTEPDQFMRRLLIRLSDINIRKPVVVFHGGKGRLATHLSASHTASLAVSGARFRGACRQYGLVETSSPVDAVLMADALAKRRVVGGRRMGIVASGSQGMYISDLCEDYGLQVPELSATDRKSIGALLPAYANSPRNPVDLAGAPDRLGLLATVLKALVRIPYIDSVIYTLPNASQLSFTAEDQVDQLTESLASVSDAGKPVVAVRWMEETHAYVRDALRERGQILVDTPEEAVRISAALSSIGRSEDS